jgi:hypothetical protein
VMSSTPVLPLSNTGIPPHWHLESLSISSFPLRTFPPSASDIQADSLFDLASNLDAVPPALEIGTFTLHEREHTVHQVGLCGALSGVDPGLNVSFDKDKCESIDCSTSRCLHLTDFSKHTKGDHWVYPGECSKQLTLMMLIGQ